jgi:outer membrane protein OmpA-like peptidoglycan-associated protein
MMTATLVHRFQSVAMMSLGIAVMLVAGCATPPAPPPAPTTAELPFDEAVTEATDALVAQTQAREEPGFQNRMTGRSRKSSVMLDPMIDAGSGQQTVATQTLQERVSERLAAKESVEIVAFQRDNFDKANYLLTGTMTRLAIDAPGGPLRIDLALTELASGRVAAQASVFTRAEGLDQTPLRYYRDTPMPTKDRVAEGYALTSKTAPGQLADAVYLEQLVVAPLIHDATVAYNAERYQEALANYSAAAKAAAGEQLNVLTGIYLSSAKLGRTAQAEQAFGRLVAFGIAKRQLDVKFLFNPDSTVFWSDPQISGPYPMWLREVARASAGAKVCVNIIGHTSRTGPAGYNDTLSLQRARYIQQRLIGEAAALGARTTASGRGFRENLIGSGTDDAIDALDRRVEFKIIDCGVLHAAN